MTAPFNIDVWGNGHLHARAGKLTMSLGADNVDLSELANALRSAGKLPALIHTPELSCRKAEQIRSAFRTALTNSDHDGRHVALYPLKASPHPKLLESLSHVCDGFEVGSKPELAQLIGLFPEGWGLELLVGGGKDQRYVDLALQARECGFVVTLLIEHPSELPLLRKAVASRHGVKLGVRAALSASGRSTWGESIGPLAKAGLMAGELLELAHTLEHCDSLQHLDLLHIHTGSQLDNEGSLRTACLEASRLTLELRRMGAAMTRLDVGGGLPASYSEVELSAQRYAEIVTNTITETFRGESHRAPDIVTEFGRFIAAPSAMLLFEITHAVASRPIGQATTEAQHAFQQGEIDLSTFAEHERNAAERGPHIYAGNFSVFRSAPDAWALQQRFPLTPLHRLDEAPIVDAIVSDATCDSQGRLRGPGPHGSHRLHLLRQDEPYLLALPLVGAYQQALGSAHNLFGEPTEVLIDADGGWSITRATSAEDSTYPIAE